MYAAFVIAIKQSGMGATCSIRSQEPKPKLIDKLTWVELLVKGEGKEGKATDGKITG